MADGPAAMTTTELTWDDLSPLLRDQWQSQTALFDCLHRHRRLIENLVAMRYQSWRGKTPLEQQDVLSELIVRLVTRTRDQQGLRWDPAHNPSAWFLRVLSNLVVDILSRSPQGRYVPGARWDDPVVQKTAVPLESSTDAPNADRLASRQTLMALETALRELRIPPSRFLAFILFHMPERLDRAMLQALVGWAPSGVREGELGLLRDPDQAWPLLVQWRERHGEDPASDTSRRCLAWILRSRDTTSPDAWRDAHPDDMARARDLLRKWDNRARAILKAAVEAP